MSATLTPEIAAPSGVASATSVFYYLLLPTLVLWYAYWKLSRRHMEELAEKLPGPKGLPLLGNALEFAGSSSGEFFIKLFLISRAFIYYFHVFKTSNIYFFIY